MYSSPLAALYAIMRLLQKNPSLQSKWDETLNDAYRLGVLLAVRETNLEESTFPEICPYIQAQILDIVLPIENYTFNRMINHKIMIYKDKIPI
jgi:hypothetical protein